ncbi:MAG: sulfatase [Lentisphaeria bacterium]|nr:sulfatase [Lentisphaeria bacterium]NQZ71065.1 sulfatase [Lentisphaeria bacterium]
MSTKPNIIFILIDDYGWKDTGCYGSSFYDTPNLDDLAANGMRFTDAYATCPVCSPTRASVMTGKYPANHKITNWINWGDGHPNKGRLIDVPYVDHISDDNVTVADALKEGGYQTWHVGKWHLGREGNYPSDHGFDVNIAGFEWGSPKNGYFSPWDLKNLENGPDGEYLTDRLGDEAVTLINSRDKDSAFFMNLWFYTVHTPIQAKEDDIRYYQRKASDMSLNQIDPFVEGDFFPVEHKKEERIRRRIIQSDPVYAAMIKCMDDNIGKLVQSLKDEGILEDTLIVFTSDNGGLATAEGSPTCNAPLSEGKGWMYEGGTREPLIVHWPGHVRAGSVSSEVVTSTDYYPTFLEAAGLPLKPEQHIDGESILPLLKETGKLEREAIFWHYPHYGNQGGTPGCSIRKGDFKLIEFFEGNVLELYNLREDISETNNLAETMPDKRDELHADLVAWRKSVEAQIPQENPDFMPWQDIDLNDPSSPFI